MVSFNLLSILEAIAVCFPEEWGGALPFPIKLLKTCFLLPLKNSNCPKNGNSQFSGQIDIRVHSPQVFGGYSCLGLIGNIMKPCETLRSLFMLAATLEEEMGDEKLTTCELFQC